ncbi:uncharacterized protein A1O9_12017 [Exophiala aquamarina CBS 119918]|uniref:Peptidase M20 domain-containing protein 2 n=1 Tax=Exophiala aquamarina CBS 119918 TaxID=1182545 RepID=A0A072NX75_9EURO|nr:uncharacterized protein A1O9_12017 [Exophiala aquamarina CBS 119918]KEF52027.1 hypothetical protein A1O9_12017 [Exophiala aquamarina CBS 119918]
MATADPDMVPQAWEPVIEIGLGVIDDSEQKLRNLNKTIHSHPELAFQEFAAVKEITTFLHNEGFEVQKHAYGLETSFAAEVGSGGPLVIICAEYDALPNIGHACGHNLIATSSIAAFLAVARVIRSDLKAGRVRLLGTPAEEGQGGKVKLIEAGAFKEEDIAAAIMAHPISTHQLERGYTGLAGMDMIASHKFKVEFHGRPAHAGGQPWNGLNALDAAIATYNNVSMLRQQMRPDERVHCVIEDGGTVPNVITQYSRMNWYVRSPSMKRCDELLEKVEKCCEAGALSTGCEFNFIRAPTYKNIRVNEVLCKQYVDDMARLGERVLFRDANTFTASTDMGNVSHEVPSFHGGFTIPTEDNISPHHPKFAEAAGGDQAHKAAIKCGKGLARLAIRVLSDPSLAESARKEFRTTKDD